MKHALALFLGIAGVLVLGDRMLGHGAAFEIGYGAIALMSVMMSATFLWLWQDRATPLALGMVFSWAGMASVMGWWWVATLVDHPARMAESAVLLLLLSLHLVGAILHFAVIERSMALPRATFILPVAGAFAISALVSLTF